MANIERLRNVDQQITSTVDDLTNDFKQRIQSILSENQLLLSNKKVFNLSIKIIFSFF
jgi:regulator of replication initiation timing